MHQIINKQTGEVTNYTDEEFIAKRDTLFMQWQDSKAKLDAAKETEMLLRKEVVDFAFDQNKDKGTENIDLGNGWKAKAVKKINYGFVKNAEGKLDKKAIDEALIKIETLGGAVGELVAERLIKWTPDLSQTEYNQLQPQFRAIIDEVIVTSEGSPTLEIVSPKAPK